MDTAPVTDDHTGEAPLLAQYSGEQGLVLRAPTAIHFIICCHDTPCIGLTDGHLEGTKVYLVHGAI